MTFVGRFFLLVLVVGFVEVYLLIKVAGSLGFLSTVGLCVLTGVVGGNLVRVQGLRTLQQIQLEMGQGRMPAAEMVSGVVLLIVGAMLVTPGFLTDIIGFLLLIPLLRQNVAQRLAGSFEARMQASATPMAGFGPGPQPPPIRGKVIDVQGEKVAPRAKETKDEEPT
ncbi:MAG: FxsA family protein [Deltaproteobacteria bacterium]|nr:FxsA family protein [Deltaproteobacteria bacterium]